MSDRLRIPSTPRLEPASICDLDPGGHDTPRHWAKEERAALCCRLTWLGPPLHRRRPGNRAPGTTTQPTCLHVRMIPLTVADLRIRWGESLDLWHGNRRLMSARWACANHIEIPWVLFPGTALPDLLSPPVWFFLFPGTFLSLNAGDIGVPCH